MPLKSDVLSVLLNNRDKDISGQALAEQFGVSRNAVWKAVNAIKEQGYDIISSTNKGYRLSPDCDILSVERIKSLLNNTDADIYISDCVDSTNNEAKRILMDKKNVNPVFIVAANEQTNGRGRFGRDFYSPKNHGLYFSIVLSPDAELNSVAGVTTYAAVCVADAISELTNQNPEIKWVNDIFIEGKKVCGILTEAVSDFESGNVSNIIIGIGINLKKFDLPTQLKNIIGFLNYDKPLKNELISSIFNKLLDFQEVKNSYIQKYKQYSLVLGKDIIYIRNGHKYFGEAVDIDRNGGLIVKTDGKYETLKSGEISLKLS